MTLSRRIIWSVGAGLAGMLFLSSLFFGVVSWAGGLEHAASLFWQDRRFIVPIILGFGIQTGLYTILKKQLFLPTAKVGPSGVLTGTGGATSTAAMVACCAHHVTDVLPILGLTAAATFLAQYRTMFMLVGLGTTLVGVAVMLFILYTERRKVLKMSAKAALPEA
ncbi:MAG TPA: hypothetical protein VIS10_11095 [Anaerolineales bacterium]